MPDHLLLDDLAVAGPPAQQTSRRSHASTSQRPSASIVPAVADEDGISERVHRECSEQGLPAKLVDRTKLAQIATLAFAGVPTPSKAHGSSRDRTSGRLAPVGRPPRARSERKGSRDDDRGSGSATRRAR